MTAYSTPSAANNANSTGKWLHAHVIRFPFLRCRKLNHELEKKSPKSQVRKTAPKRSRAPATTADQATADEATATSAAALPFGFLLRSMAESVPGSTETVVYLAWLSGNDQARSVVRRWASLSCQAKQKVELEEVCRAVGADTGQFIATVAATGFELGVNGFIAAIDRPTGLVNPAMIAQSPALYEQFWRFVAFSKGAAPMLEKISLAKALGRRGPSSRIGRGGRVVSAEDRRSCREMAAARKKWKLSRKQFAELLFVNVRMLERWRNCRFCPSGHQRWALHLLIQYADEHGVGALRRRFVGQPPRYAKHGRPAKAVSL
jgi:hypothetical protein